MYKVYYNNEYLMSFDDLGEAEEYIEVCKEDKPQLVDLYKIEKEK